MRSVSYGGGGSCILFNYLKLYYQHLKQEYLTTTRYLNSFYFVHYKLKLNDIMRQEKIDLIHMAQFALTLNPSVLNIYSTLTV